MRTEKEIRDKIKEVTDANSHVLDVYPATVFSNAPRALMQVNARSTLKALYWCLDDKYPKFNCDEFSKTDKE